MENDKLIEKEWAEEEKKGKPKMTWRQIILKELQILNISVDLTSNRTEWWQRIHIVNRN